MAKRKSTGRMYDLGPIQYTAKEEDDTGQEPPKFKQHGTISRTLRRLRHPIIAPWTRHSTGFSVSDTGSNNGRVASVYNTRALIADKNKWDQLQEVKTLSIHDEDGMYGQVPKDILELHKLETLEITLSNIKHLNPDIFCLGITELSLPRNNLKSLDGVSLGQTLVKIDITDNCLHNLTDEIGHLDKLQTLCLKGNKLKSLPSAIGRLANLVDFDCSSNKLTSFPDEICQLTRLVNFDFSRNRVRGLPANTGNMAALVDLRGTHNHLSNLPHSFVHLIQLKSLFLSNNRFDDFPPMLYELPSLMCLSMRSNTISEVTSPLPHLEHLLFDDNDLLELSQPLLQSQKLTIFSVEYNRIERIHPAIGRLNRLRTLYLTGNQLTTLPDEICKLGELRHLAISDNEIADLPSAFGRLYKLSQLQVSTDFLNEELALAYKQEGISGLRHTIRRRNDQGYK